MSRTYTYSNDVNSIGYILGFFYDFCDLVVIWKTRGRRKAFAAYPTDYYGAILGPP